MTDTYWYLATPYTNFEGGHEAAWIMACEQTALLLKAGVPVFSPIAHTHPIAKVGKLQIVDHDFWVNVVDAPMMKGAHGIIHLAAKGWQKSSGMHEEIVHFVKAGKPVVFMQPGVVPVSLLNGHPKLPKPMAAPNAMMFPKGSLGWSGISAGPLQLLQGVSPECAPSGAIVGASGLGPVHSAVQAAQAVQVAHAAHFAGATLHEAQGPVMSGADLWAKRRFG